MAIILEQKKTTVTRNVVVGVFVVLLLVAGIAYWVFFSRGEGVVPPVGDATGGISKINTQVFQEVGESSIFKSLNQYPRLNAETVRTHLGRTNPFAR